MLNSDRRYCYDCRWLEYIYYGKQFNDHPSGYWCRIKNMHIGPGVLGRKACEDFETE